MSDKLKKSLEELHEELERLGSDEPKLKKLAEEVQLSLDENREEIPLIDSLRDAAETFETRHPKLTGIINNVMNSLSGLGI